MKTIDDVKIGMIFRYEPNDSRWNFLVRVIEFEQNSLNLYKEDKGLTLKFKILESNNTSFPVGKIYHQGLFSNNWNNDTYILISTPQEEFTPIRSRLAYL